jgi:hypothetical protein
MKVRDRGNKMKKENTCMIWKGGLKNITNEKQNKYMCTSIAIQKLMVL